MNMCRWTSFPLFISITFRSNLDSYGTNMLTKGDRIFLENPSISRTLPLDHSVEIRIQAFDILQKTLSSVGEMVACYTS